MWRGNGGRRRRSRGDPHSAREGRFWRDGRHLADRHLPPVRRPPRRVRDGRGRRRTRARVGGAGARTRGPHPRRGARLRGHRRRPPPDRARAHRPPGGDRDQPHAEERRDHPGADRLRQRPRHLDAAQRPLRDRGDQARAGRAGLRHPRVIDQVGDWAPARRGRGGRGDRHPARAERPRRASDPGLRGARPGSRSRLRARRSPRSFQRQRPSTRGDLELVRVWWPQRGRLPGRRVVSATLVPSPQTEARPLDALGRLETLCDRGSLELIRSDVLSAAMGEKARSGDGVLAGAGTIDGRPVYCYAQDQSYAGGSLGEQHANTIVRVLELADRAKAPVVGFVSSGGARMQEGVAALGGYGRIFHRIVKLSGRVPQVSIVTGLSAGGGAYSPALTDWVVMTEESSMFLTGPGVVREALGEDVTAAELGGTRVHERNGVCHFVAPTDANAAYLARELLGYLPRHRGARAPMKPPRAPLGYDPSDPVPSDHRSVYDVRDVTRALVDGG